MFNWPAECAELVIYEKKFGFYPHPLAIEAGEIKVSTLPELDKTVKEINSDKYIEKDWLYASPQYERICFSGGVRELPYAGRVFGLPQTHTIKHLNAKSEEHIDFLVWVLSFFTGMRLTTTEAGFLDATPIKESTLVDFLLLPADLNKVLILADNFWNKNGNECCLLFTAAVHTMFISQNPRNLPFEEFIYAYLAIDTCYALTKRLYPPNKKNKFRKRIRWMCNTLGVQVPKWGDPKHGKVSDIRNKTLHEALFMENPLGFLCAQKAVSLGNLPFEMENLVCRLLVALIGVKDKEYIESPADRRTYCRLNV